ncbi:glutathione S-transferase family protein [Leucothrix arctica]|uniref:Glutathione S-transferase family protein n=1 Tax=Leucothrix arctica TaxID=1481894 RepID=A0A317C4X5_9GAMM|nr:glutathione S-transferase family protein [Leucothrix arctica]PWQ93695.1 glutathione S-transferase family protein [Leucothrix arctica]
MLKLHQFPISHYCEKARWALEIKELQYRKVNLLPGPHIKKAKKIAKRSSLPILEHDGVFIQESSDIITYLDNNFSRRSLTPEQPKEQELAAAWESFADREIGPAVRLLCYSTLLDHPGIMIPLFTKNGPWYGRWALKPAFPKIAESMRDMFKITPQSAIEAENKVSTALDNLNATLGDREFLVGDTFTRADLSVASLLSPLIMHRTYGVEWPDSMPEPLASQMTSFHDRLGWVEHIYDNFR